MYTPHDQRLTESLTIEQQDNIFMEIAKADYLTFLMLSYESSIVLKY